MTHNLWVIPEDAHGVRHIRWRCISRRFNFRKRKRQLSSGSVLLIHKIGTDSVYHAFAGDICFNICFNFVSILKNAWVMLICVGVFDLKSTLTYRITVPITLAKQTHGIFWFPHSNPLEFNLCKIEFWKVFLKIPEFIMRLN